MDAYELQALFVEIFGRDGTMLGIEEMCARAVVIFLFGIAVVRIAGARVFGKWAVIDIVLAILIGSNLSRTLTGGAPLIPTLVATALLVALHYMLAHLAWRFPVVTSAFKGRPIHLIRDGAPDDAAMRRESVDRRDLEAAVRAAGLEAIDEADAAVLERSGEINVIPKTQRRSGERKPGP